MKTSLKIEPVLTNKTPKYPDKYSVALDKMLLASTPMRWNNPLVKSIAGTALSFSIMATLAGCATNGTGVSTEKVAPLFEHGEGIGTIACVAVAILHFLSEADALQIITDELAKKGISAVKSERVVENLKLPIVDSFGTLFADKPEPVELTGSVTLDLELEGTNLAVEYLSEGDYFSFSKWDNHGVLHYTSVESYQFKKVARGLLDSFEALEDTDTTYAVFYDPVQWEMRQPTWEWPWKKTDSTELLRAQVRDFIQWLAAQGVI